MDAQKSYLLGAGESQTKTLDLVFGKSQTLCPQVPERAGVSQWRHHGHSGLDHSRGGGCCGGCWKAFSRIPGLHPLEAYSIPPLPAWAGVGRFGGLQRGGGSRTCDCVGKGKHSGANVRSRAPLSPSRHFGKPCPGATPGPRRTGVGTQDSPKGSGNVGHRQPSRATP